MQIMNDHPTLPYTMFWSIVPIEKAQNFNYTVSIKNLRSVFIMPRPKGSKNNLVLTVDNRIAAVTVKIESMHEKLKEKKAR